MKIKYLGTAAAEGIPAISCTCSVCVRSKKAGGRNIRSRSQAVIDDKLLIDFNSDTLWHVNAFDVDLSQINDCIITHSHEDHLYPDDINNYNPWFCHGRTRPMVFYSGKSGYDKIKAVADRDSMEGAVQTVLVSPYTSFKVCDGLYDVFPIIANHDQNSTPFIYSIDDGNKKLLYGNDTGWLCEDSWLALKKRGYHDFVSLDCTGGVPSGGEWVDGHMSLGTVKKAILRMKEEGIIDQNTTIVIHHFSHNGCQTYDDLCAAVNDLDIIVSYDGLEIEF